MTTLREMEELADANGKSGKLLKRMRELGIEPVVQSFAGFVPDTIKRLHPEAKTMETLWNGGFGSDQRPKLLLPDEPLYQTIGKAFIEEWRKEFGNAKYYLADSFNELKNIKPDAAKFAEFGEKTLSAITAADPDAIWVIQGWIFSYQRKIWSKENVKALFSNIPDDKVLIIDYANDYRVGWSHFEGFYGKPYVMGYVPNMGGKVAYTGHFKKYAKGISEMLKSPYSKNCVGFTISGEGLENNQALYELVSDTAWSKDAIELGPWLNKYNMARYGDYPESVRKAWGLYLKSCYGSFTPHPMFGWQGMKAGHKSVNRDPRFTEGVLSFLEARKALKHSISYQDDALEMVAIALSIKVDDWFDHALKLKDAGSTAEADQCWELGLQLMLKIDRLLESHSLHRLERWVDLARKHSSDEKLNDFYESNARRIITVWGPPVNDYSCRLWSGLIRDFYQPRMKVLYDRLKGKRINRREWEEKWVMSKGISKVEPYREPVEQAFIILAETIGKTLPKLVIVEVGKDFNEGALLGEWMPNTVSKDWADIEFDLTVEQLKTLKGVRFKYTKGDHRLEIESVSVVADGDSVADEKHFGYTGGTNKNNSYVLDIPKGVNANNGCSIRAKVRSAGGTNSYGKVILIKE